MVCTAAFEFLDSAVFAIVSDAFEVDFDADAAAVADDLTVTLELTECRMRDSSTSSTTNEFSMAIQYMRREPSSRGALSDSTI